MSKKDDGWVKVQHKTFIGWANYYLKERAMRVEALDQDLGDGLLLVNLVEILTKKTVPKIIKSPTTVIHKIQNCGLALKAIADAGVMQLGCAAEGISRPKNFISYPDIVEGNLKLLLGLMWSLILHFQIMEDTKDKGKKESAKDSLMQWLKDYLAEYKVDWNGFPKSLKDGKVFLYLVHKRESSLVDLSVMDDQSPYERLLIGFDIAERALSIPKLLEPQDVIDNPDEQSLLTYISYFKAHLNKPVNMAAESKLQAEMEDLRRQFEEESSHYKGNVEDLKKKLEKAESTKFELEKLQSELERANKDKMADLERQRKIEEDLFALKQGLLEKEQNIKEAYTELKAKHKQCAVRIKELKQEKEQVEFELEEVWKKLKDEKDLRAAAEGEKTFLNDQLEELKVKSKADSSKAIALQSQLERVGDDMKGLKEKLARTKEKKKNLQWELDRKIREYEKNAASLTDVAKYDELNRQVTGLKEEIEQLKERISELEKEREKLRSRIHVVEAERDDAQQSVINLKAANEKLMSDLTEVKNLADRKKRKMQSIKEDKKRLEEDIESAQRKYRNYIKSYGDIDSVKKSLEDNITDLKNKLRAANQEKTEYQEQTEAIQHEMSRTKYKLAEVDKLKKKVKEEKEKRKRAEEEFETQIEELRGQLLQMDKRTDIVPMSDLEKEFDEKKRKMEEDLKEFKKNLESKDNKIEKLEQAVEDAKLELENKTQQLQSIQKREESFESEKTELAKQVDALKKQVETSTEAVSLKEALEEEVNKLKADGDERKKKFETLKEEKKKLEEEYNSMKLSSVTKEEASKVESEVKRLTIEVAKAQEEASDLREQKDRFEKSEKKLKEETEKLQQELQKARDESAAISATEVERLEEKVKNLKKDLEANEASQEETKTENQKLKEELEALKQKYEIEVMKIRDEQQKAAERAANPANQKLKEQSSKIKTLLNDVLAEFMKLRQQLELATDYNDAIKISKRIRDAKKTLEASVVELTIEEGQVKKYLQSNPRSPTEEVENVPSKDDYGSKENYQKVKKLREVVVFAIEKALDDLHFINLRLDEAQSKEEMVHIAQISQGLLQAFVEENSASEAGSDAEASTPGKSRKAVDAEVDIVQEKIKELRTKLENSSMEKAVDIARSIRYVKKDMQDFFSEHQLPLPAEVQPTPTPGEDKFVALKKMMLATLDRISSQANVLKKEASQTENQEKLAKYLEKLAFVNKSFS